MIQSASAMVPTMGISWRKKLNPDAIPTIFECPEPTGTSSVASDSGREPRLRLVTAFLSLIANRNDQKGRMKKESELG